MAKPEDQLVGNLADRISAKIFAGEYPPGSPLRQEALAEEFSVSRTPVREALRQLEAKGIIQHRPNQGAIVLAPNARDIRDAYQIRAELEGLAISLAAEWITDEQIARMSRAQKRFADTVEKLIAARKSNTKAQLKNVPNWVESNDEFHGVVIEASGNGRLKKMIQDLHLGFTRNVMLSALTMDGRRMRENVSQDGLMLGYVLTMDGRRMRENVSQHEAILAAMNRHDAVEARNAMTHHILRSGELAVWWLESQGKLLVGSETR